jgi:monoterpene epsilon-lactone hydrolase
MPSGSRSKGYIVQRGRFPAPSGISAEAGRFLKEALPLTVMDIDTGGLAEQRRKIYDQVVPGGKALARRLGVQVKEGEAGGVPVQWISPAEQRNDHIILYFFGGGHITGSPDEDLSITARLAHFSGARVCAPRYRLAPEHPYPAAREDALAVYRALNAGPGRLALAGESAGANLALSLLGALGSQGISMPGALALLSPWCDLTHSGDTILTLDGIDPSLDYTHHLQHMARAYAGGRALDDPGISPLFADVPPGLPPTVITTGTRDVLLSDCARLSAKLRAAGVQVDLRVHEGMWHVFEYYPDLPEAEVSTRDIAAFLIDHLMCR